MQGLPCKKVARRLSCRWVLARLGLASGMPVLLDCTMRTRGAARQLVWVDDPSGRDLEILEVSSAITCKQVSDSWSFHPDEIFMFNMFFFFCVQTGNDLNLHV